MIRVEEQISSGKHRIIKFPLKPNFFVLKYSLQSKPNQVPREKINFILIIFLKYIQQRATFTKKKRDNAI
jgi:hypothetical protein